MSIQIIAYGTGNPATHEFVILQDHEHVARITVNQDDLQELIAELSEWTDHF